MPEEHKEKALTHDPRYHWDREEHLLLLDMYLRHKDQVPGKESDEVEVMSNLLRRYHKKKGNPVHEALRNQNGVYMKLMNFRRFDPGILSKGLEKGNKLEGEVWDEYSDKPEELSRIAELIKQSILNDENLPSDEEAAEQEEMETEGRVIGLYHKRHERSTRNREKKVKQFKKENGRLFCEVCGFDFEVFYGERGADFCEIHHDLPVSKMSFNQKTDIKDLKCLCSNCHRIIHRKKPWMTTEELRQAVKSISSRQASNIQSAFHKNTI